MSSTFNIFSIKSVPSTYSWDKGTPSQDFNEFRTGLSTCSAVSNNKEGVEYIGYAPYVCVSFSSAPGDISENSAAFVRTANFGDFYNTESNSITYSTIENELFCHTYVMPGLYTIRFERTEYVKVTEKPFVAYGDCLQKHCIDWSWKTLATCTPELSVTWASTLDTPGKQWTKKWKFEPCDADWATSNGLYIQSTGKQEVHPLLWQWYNFMCTSQLNTGTESACYLVLQEDGSTPITDQEYGARLLVNCSDENVQETIATTAAFNNPHNTPTKWSSTKFQQADQLTWAQSSGPCIELAQTEQTLWKWDTITTIPGQFNTPITWDETICSSPANATWDHVRDNCSGTTSESISSSTQTIVKEALIRVLEIPPTAYLKVIQPTDRNSPLTVRLSPAFTLCGSFPIEKIVWDLGDGSPLLTQRRWSNTLASPFVYSGELSEDYQDPRNYDVIHTYAKTPDSGYSFYPSITAYCSSTNSSDCASAMVGPLRLPTTDGANFKLLQNELTEHGKVLIGQIDNNVAVWRADK